MGISVHAAHGMRRTNNEEANVPKFFEAPVQKSPMNIEGAMIAAWPVCSLALNPKRAAIPGLAYPVFRSTTGPSPFLYAGDQFNDRRQAQIVWIPKRQH